MNAVSTDGQDTQDSGFLSSDRVEHKELIEELEESSRG